MNKKRGFEMKFSEIIKEVRKHNKLIDNACKNVEDSGFTLTFLTENENLWKDISKIYDESLKGEKK